MACDEDSHMSFGWAFFFIMVGAIVSFGLGLVCMEQMDHVEAVKKGHAKWTIMDEKGNVKWEWIEK